MYPSGKIKSSKSLFLFLLITLFLLSSQEVEATKKMLDPPPEYSEDISIQSTTYLKVWSVFITQISGNEIEVSGDTESYNDVDTIKLKLYLQYWNGNNWLDAAYLGQYSKTSTNYVSGISNATVGGGYYYRTRGVHTVNHSGTVEEINSYSSYIHIN